MGTTIHVGSSGRPSSGWALARAALSLSLLATVGCPRAPRRPTPRTPPTTATQPRATWLGQELPGQDPAPWLPQLRQAGRMEHAVVVSPSEPEVLFTVSDPEYGSFDVMTSRFDGHQWSTPTRAWFSDDASEHGTWLAPDGGTLWFSSTRATGGQSKATTWAAWRSVRTNGRWSPPRRVHIPGFEDRWHSHVVSTEDGTLYFHGPKSGSTTDYDLYSWSPDADPQGPRRLPFNTTLAEVTPHWTPDERLLLFTGYDRPDGHGGGDLYAVRRRADGTWTAPRNLGPWINTAFEESNPTVSPDGRFLMFSSARPTDPADLQAGPLHLYWVSTEGLGLPAADG